ncbi:MAG: efflux RND transporter periplasmic adaptor subunit, partial [Lewinella sp.]|nr:efflux RND transporter periplasmic adaptor subunit [Lewinella sp.]
DHSHDMTAEAGTGEEIWTCSMHPQIRQNEPGQCPICGMDLIPLAENSSSDPLVLEMTTEAAKLAQVQTTVVGAGAGASGRTLRLSGKVQADERLAASQVTHIPGRIEKLYVTFTGEQIRKGQRLADLYSPELITAQRELLEAKRMANINPALLEAARNKLRFWKIPEARIQEIEDSEQTQETFPIYADAPGTVTNRRVAVGDYVRQGEVLFDLVDLSRVWVLFDAYEEDLSHIRLGSTIAFTTPAVPNQTFSARVTFIDPVINPQTRVASIRVEVNNPGGRLKPEMLVYGTLESPADPSVALTVPKSAVLWTGPRSVVYVKLPNMAVPSFQYREVELGDRIGDSYQVMAGLEAGEEVVTNGNFAIDAAAQLNNQASMMNQNVALSGVEVTEQLPDFADATPEAFKQQLVGVVDDYMVLKDALVADDALLASASAGALLSSLELVRMELLSGEAHRYWMTQLAALQSHGGVIGEKTADLEAQRKQFGFLSEALIRSVKAFGVPEGAYY